MFGDVLYRKLAFFDRKTSIKKKRKICIFRKGFLFMVLVKNFRLVYFFVLSKFGLQRLFGDFVKRKLAFLHDILFVSYRWKNGHFWTKTMSYPLWKNVNFSTFWTFCFYSLERCFFVLEYRKRHFPGLYCLKKASWKNVNFSTFWTSYFYSLERRFFVLEYHKRHFPGLYCLKKKFDKWPFLDQNLGLNPLEKCQFFRLFELLVFIA